jgi:hypothetical protein
MLNEIRYTKIFYFSLIFILLTVIGTQLHEYGHYLTAYYFNFNPKLHFASVSYDIESNSEFYSDTKVLLIKIAGPLQTLFSGILGLIVIKRNKIRTKIWWIGIFLTLFLLRQVFVMFYALANSYFKGKFIFGGDEAKIAKILGLQSGLIVLFLGVASTLICLYVYFVLIPKSIRLNFIIGSLIGSFLGFIIWFNLIGKFFLP